MNMKLRRIKLGLTQSQLKEKSNVGLNTIVTLEKGNIDSIKIGTLKKVAAALDTTVEKLFFSEEE